MKKHLNASYALYLSLYLISACFVYGYTRLFLGRLGFSADEVGLLLALDCAGAMVLQPLLARVIEGPGPITMRRALPGMAVIALLSGGLLLFPRPKAVLVCLFAVMGLMTMAAQPFVNAVGFGYMNRGARLNWSVTRGVASLAFALFSKVYATLAERDMKWLPALYLLSMAGVLVCSPPPGREGSAGGGAPAPGPAGLSAQAVPRLLRDAAGHGPAVLPAQLSERLSV